MRISRRDGDLHSRYGSPTLNQKVPLLGACYLHGRRVRLALLVPGDTLWLGTSAAGLGLQYHVAGIGVGSAAERASDAQSTLSGRESASALSASQELPASGKPRRPAKKLGHSRFTLSKRAT